MKNMRNKHFMSDLESIGGAFIDKEDIPFAEEKGLNVIPIGKIEIDNPLVKMLLDHSGKDFKEIQNSYHAIVVKFKPGIV